MNVPRISSSVFRTATLVAFAVACVTFAGYLYAQAGGTLPGFNRTSGYTVSFDVDQVANLVTYADVQEAGVPVGKVDALNRVSPDRVRVVLTLEPVATPIHQGATVQISEKSLAGQPNVVLVDGTGPAFPDGTVLPASSVKPSVQLRDVLASLDKPTRDALGGVVRSLGQSTDGRQTDVSSLAEGLADIGGNGATALDAIAAQSGDLEQISRQLNQIFDSLDTGQGQIAQLVSSADRLSAATAGQRPALEATVRKLPGVLDSATTASGGISQLSGALSPVAADLRRAAPDLDDALNRLPESSADLRDLLPTLHSVLDHAPATLDKVPDFGSEARDFIPPTVSLLRDLNPALRYLRPYGLDISQIFTDFGAAYHHYGEDGGSYIYLRPFFTTGSVRPDPIKYPAFLQPSNPYPAPGGLRNLKPFTGQYPRVERDGG
ncbi:MAG: phospholipid/cholesterol/gamma-HCH transport system substrate-binding protein [Pseudonocardiales bacterium]|nr:phospholipid/cholesterol/gamma-HCH transport system substrate-binding protein [Pseudonocardiales bacterium]